MDIGDNPYVRGGSHFNRRSKPNKLKSLSYVQPLLQNSVKTVPDGKYDYDLLIVGCGVGGHGAALHAVSKGLKVGVLTGSDVGGTCVNRGCVPSKALLAATGRVREISDTKTLEAMGVFVNGPVKYDRAAISKHASKLVSDVRRGLEGSLVKLGVDLIHECGVLTQHDNEVQAGSRLLTAKDIILATGSKPFVPKGIQVDEETVFTSDGGLQLKRVPKWLAIVGSGYIGLEFSDIFTALGTEVTFVEAMDRIMPTFDKEIAQRAESLLIKNRPINSKVNVFAAEVTPGVPDQSPVRIKLIDAKTKEFKEWMEVDACLVATGRAPDTKGLNLGARGVELTTGGVVPVDERMRVLRHDGHAINHLYCIGDANGKMMLAHAASSQGVSAVENIIGNQHVLRHETIPAACFTHPEIAFVGLNEEEAKKRGDEGGFKVLKAVSHFRANSKALAELHGDGIVKVMYREDSGEVLGVHIIGLHASDLIQEAATAMALNATVNELSLITHAHPTLSEVMDSAWKAAVGGLPSH
eukprot:GHVN01023764.1.p1 GENE.GHVN01023764.1~~GHVN01023764.1.p1  ORF type:complete len:614 (-),score=116.62 GHVN01023764.1:191-1765(-)